LIARRKVNRFSTKDYTSPVSGVLERILPSGTLFVREKAEDAKQLTIVNVAKDLRVYVEQIKPYLRVEPGQEIDRNQWVAAMVKPGDMRVSRSPVRGKIKEINLEYGIVTIEPLLEELAINAWLPGRVKQISDRGCLVENQGISIEGIWGQGGEVFGKLQLTEVSAESIMIRDVVSSDELRKFDEANITGLITGGLHLKDVLDINPGYTIVVVEGFGEQPLPEAIRQILHKNVGQTALSCGTTEMRVGVRRPQVIFPES